MALLLGFVWACAVLEWPCRFLPETSAGRWIQAGFLSFGIVLFGGLSLLPVCRHWKHLGTRSLTICSYCRKVHNGRSQWDHFEDFFARRRLADFSHGVCPDCREQVMQDYRQGRQDAGAPPNGRAPVLPKIAPAS